MDKRVIAPTLEPLTLAQAKQELEVVHTSDDDKITAKIKEARAYVEDYTGQKLMPQTWDLILDCFPTPGVSLTHWPVQSVASVIYLNATGGFTTVPADAYFADTVNGWVGGEPIPSAPVPNAVQIRYECGYASADEIPEAMLAAIKYKLRLLFDAIGADNAAYFDNAIKHLLDPHRRNMGV